jgi:hypothetical protein
MRYIEAVRSIGRRLHQEFDRLPGLMRAGLATVLLSGALDVVFHALPAAWAATALPWLGPHATALHVVTLFGMLVTLAGLFPARIAILRRVVVNRKEDG